MKMILKKVLILTFSLVLFAGLATPISAETNNQSSGDKTEESGPTPRWWPGNPNPLPGSEAWLQNHMYLPAPSVTARRCASSALIGTSLTSGVGAWITRGPLTAFSFGATFGAGYLISYTLCVYGI